MLEERTARGSRIKCRNAARSPSRSSGKYRFDESPRYFRIVGGFQGELAQIVLIEEAIEKIRAKNDGGRNGDLHTFELPPNIVIVDQRVQKTEAARFAAQGSSADAGETGLGIERILFEFRDQAALLKPCIGSKRRDQVPAQSVDGWEIRYFARPELVREPEFRSRLQPVGKMVALGMKPDAFLGHILQLLPKAFQVGGPPDFVPFGSPENKVSEAEVFGHELPQLEGGIGRILWHERQVQGLGFGFVIRSEGLQQNRQFGIFAPHSLCKPDPGAMIGLAFAREVDIRNDAQDVFLVGLEIVPGFLVGPAKQNLGPCHRLEDFVREVDAFGNQPLGLVEKLRIQDGQKRGIVVDIVFDEKNGLDADQPRVVVDIHPVFQMLDDADNQPEIPLPDEDAVECRRVVVRFEVLQFPAVIRQQNDGDLDARLPGQLGQPDGGHVLHVHRRQDEIETPLLFRQGDRLLPARYARQFGRMAQIQPLILVADQLIETAVFFEQIEIVKAGDKKDVPDSVAHQVLKTLKARSVSVLDPKRIQMFFSHDA